MRVTHSILLPAAFLLAAPLLHVTARAQPPTEVRGILDLSGTWARSGELRGSCEGVSDSRGLPRIGCRFPVAELALNARARAWIEFVDEPIEGKFYCVPESIPGLFMRRDPVRIEQRADRVVMDHEVYLSANVRRTIWTDGRSHPPPSDVAYYGHSIGHYEDDELVVVTRNFTFDPNGIDYQGQIPSSFAKVLTQRYSRTGSNTLRMTLTVEDPVFLSEPYTETIELTRTDDPVIEWMDCDIDAAWQPLMMLPPKYPDEQERGE